jgi:undecaprenyl-diphosphatase
MVDIVTALVLGVVEGATEMLPVSSTGHLIIFNEWFSFGEPFTTMFDVVIQFGAILAVLTYFWSQISPFRPASERREVLNLWLRIGIGILPILAIAYLLGSDILDRFFSVEVVGIALIVGGLLLLAIDRFTRPDEGSEQRSSASLSLMQTMFVSLTHILGLIPGMSRSASATIGAMAVGAPRKVASEFSMLMAIPVLFVASLYSLLHFDGTLDAGSWGLLAIGFLTSWAVCYLTVRWFFGFIRRFGLQHFGYYRVILGILVLLFL